MAGSARRLALGAVLHRLRPQSAARLFRSLPEGQAERLGQAAARAAQRAASRRALRAAPRERMAACSHEVAALLPRSQRPDAFHGRDEFFKHHYLRCHGGRGHLLDAAAAGRDGDHRPFGAQAFHVFVDPRRRSFHRAARLRPARQGGRIPGRARSAYASRARMAARLAPQARCGALAPVPPLAYPRREAAAQARRSGRARHRDLANLHRRAGRLPRGADDPRQGLRIRRRGSDAFQHEEPDEGLRPLRARRPGRPAAAGVQRQGDAAFRPEAFRSPSHHSGQLEMKKLLASLALGIASLVYGQSYPSKPIKIIIPFPPGNTTDIMTRLIGPKMAERLGQQIVVENRPGASGMLGLDLVAKSAPDGYTIGAGQGGNLVVLPHTSKSIPYDSLKDFAPIAVSTTNYLGIVAAITYTHVPYKGSAAIATDIMGGQVQAGIDGITGMTPHIKSGRLRLLAVTNPTRVALWPDTPAAAEDVPGYESGGWFGYVAPAGTPRDIVLKLNGEINRAMQQPDVAEKLVSAGLIVVTESPEYFSVLLKNDFMKYGKLVQDIGYRPQ